jgi:hypothetical protein
MTTKYSVIQYLPNPLADERINVGIVAFDDDEWRVVFTDSWQRIQYFAGEDEPFLRELKTKLLEDKEEVRKLVLHIERVYAKSEDHQIQTTTWMSILQFTQPQTSILGVQETLEMTHPHFLPQITALSKYALHACQEELICAPGIHIERPRNRKAVAGLVVKDLLDVLLDLPQASNLRLEKKEVIQGRRQSHTFDAAIVNGKPLLAAQGVSFEVNQTSNTQKYLSSVSWMISDVKDFDPDFQIVVYVLPPKENGTHVRIYDETVKVYEDLGARVLTESNVKSETKALLSNLRQLSGESAYLPEMPKLLKG